MTVGELISWLENFPEDHQVLLATQPAWPFEYTIAQVEMVGEAVYLAEGQQTRYLPEAVVKELGWRR